MDTAYVQDLIRQAAQRHGIDPDTALRVARSEGLNEYVGDAGSSFGPFQLHYGGVASGGNKVSGLGDTFTARTGLDARDPSTVPQQIDFALAHAAKNGWGDWHGAQNIGLSNFAGIGGKPVFGLNGPQSQPNPALDNIGAGAFAPQAPPASGYGGGAPTGAGPGVNTGAGDPYIAAIRALMSQPHTPTQPRPGLLGQLLFGQGGLGGAVHQLLPQGILGGAVNGLARITNPQGGASPAPGMAGGAYVAPPPIAPPVPAPPAAAPGGYAPHMMADGSPPVPPVRPPGLGVDASGGVLAGIPGLGGQGMNHGALGALASLFGLGGGAA